MEKEAVSKEIIFRGVCFQKKVKNAFFGSLDNFVIFSKFDFLFRLLWINSEH